MNLKAVKINGEDMWISSNVIPLLLYPLNEHKAFTKSDILAIEKISHGLLKLRLTNGETYTIKGDLEEIYKELNRK